MTLQSLIHSTITTILSPSKSSTSLETDYEIEEPEESLHSISNRIISQRQQGSNFSTPTRSTRSRGSPERRNGSLKITSRRTDPVQLQHMVSDYDDDRDKIRQFVNVKQMLTSLRNLERLITDEDINYNEFKKTYVESSLGLLESIQDKRDVQYGTINSSGYSVGDQKDLVVKIGLVCVQIFVVLIDLFTPLLVQATILLKQVLNNDLVKKVLNVIVELVFVILNLFLDYLKKYQAKSKRQLREAKANRSNTRHDNF